MAGIGIPSNVFKKIGVSERKLIFKILGDRKGALYIKIDGKLFFFVANQVAENRILWLDFTESSAELAAKDPLKGEVVINFSIDEDRYFMVTEYVTENKRVGVRCDKDLYFLQRRSHRRVQIPEDYSSTFNILGVNDKPAFIEMKVEDFSAGGMRLVETRDEVKAQEGDVIKGTLKIGAKANLNLEAEVRFSDRKFANGKEVAVLGVEFLKVDKMLEGRLMTMVAQLQQEFAAKAVK